MSTTRPHVVIVGAGFGGLAAAKALARVPVDVTIVDRRNHHLFQPLLYQVATAGLNPSDIAQPIRRIVAKQENCRVLLGAVHSIDVDSRTVSTNDGTDLTYDYLVVATGATHAYFGNDQWAAHAPGLKSLEDALDIRRRILLAFERAEATLDAALRSQLMTFVVVGAGPTGVELAGAVQEIATKTLHDDFRSIDTHDTTVILVEAGPRVLPTFPEKLSESALRQLTKLGIDVRTGTRVTDIDGGGVTTDAGHIPAATVMWAAGVAASPLGRQLTERTDRAGRVPVSADLSLPDHREVFVIGDLALVNDAAGDPVPGVAPAAQQGGAHVAASITADLAQRQRTSFSYRDKGSMATIGRSAAVVNISPRLQFGGYVAWLVWWVVHIFSLVDFNSRVRVMVSWGWQYVAGHRNARLITGRLDDS